MGWWAAGGWAGDNVSMVPWSWGYWPYYNPYYGGSYVTGSAFDYSQPIVVAQAAAAPPGAPAGLTAEQQATPLFDAARTAFLQGDYKTALALAGDGKFTWAVDQNGKPQQFSGTYTVADNHLVLKQGNNALMVGQVAALASDRFNFKLAGDNPSDPGLTFVR